MSPSPLPDRGPLLLIGVTAVVALVVVILIGQWWPWGADIVDDTVVAALPAQAPTDAPVDEGGEEHAHAHGPGHAHDASPSPQLTPALEARVASLLEEHDLGYRVDCVPDPPDFRPAPPPQLFEDSFIVPPTPQPHGGFRLEVTERRGFKGLHDHGYTEGMLHWDLDADPACTVSPTPSRYVVDTIPDWRPDLELYVCKEQVVVSADGRVEDEVDGGYNLIQRPGGGLDCPATIYDDDQAVRFGTLAMDGEGPGRIEGWVVPESVTDPGTAAEDELEDLQARMAEIRSGEDPILLRYGERLEGLAVLMDADPQLAEVFAQRKARLIRERDRNHAEYVAFIEDLLAKARERQGQESEVSAGGAQDTAEP